MSNSNDSKPEWRPGDSRMADFMHQASQILASERGWNDRSKMLIQSLANDLQLPKYQYEDAVDQLQHGKLDFEDRFSTYEKAFIKYLTRQFEKSQIGVLTAAHESTAIRKARREFEIGQTRARHLIRHVAEQLNISRVSKRDAVEYVAAIIDETIGNETVVSDEMRGRIFEAGVKWGVESNQIEILVQNRIDANHQETRTANPWVMKSVAALMSLLILVAIGWLGLRVIQQANFGADPQPAEEGNNNNLEPIIEEAFKNPDRWSKRTSDLFESFSLNTRFATFPHNLLRSTDSKKRIQGYQSLLASLVSAKKAEAISAQAMFALMFVEEEMPVRREIAALLRKSSQVFNNNLPNNIKSWQEEWRVLDLLLACKSTALDSQTVMPLDEYAYQLTGMSIRDAGFEKQCMVGLAKRHWQILQTFSFRQPDRVARLVDSVSDLTNRQLGYSLGNEHATTMTLLNIRPGTWSRMRSTLQFVVETAGQDQLREIYLANSKFDDPELQRWLANKLANQLNVKTQGVTVERIDLGIRKELGLHQVANNRLTKRWQRFFSAVEVKRLTSNDGFSFESPQPQSIADAVHWGTIAILMSEAESNPTPQLLNTIDQLVSQDPRDLSIRTTSLVNDLRGDLPLYQQIERRPVPSDLRTFENSLARLAKPSESARAKALAFEQIGTVASRINRLTQEQAETIARFMLGASETSELVSIEQHAGKLRHWPNLALKMADVLPGDEGTLDQAVTCASLLLDLEPALGGSKPWREQLSRQIVRRVGAGLRHTAERRKQDQRYQWNELRDLLVDYYRIRCQAVNAEPARINAAESPSDLAKLFVVQFARSSSQEAAALVQASEFVANSDLQELAMLGDIALETLPVKGDESQQKKPTSAVEQIYRNEVLLLRALSKDRRVANPSIVTGGN